MRRRSFLTLVAGGSLAARAELARGGRLFLPVVVSPAASPRVRQAAAELATCLGRITGQTPAVTSAAAPGIVVGLLADFSFFDRGGSDPAKDGPDDYWISSRAGGLFLIGAGEAGVENAVWDFLHRLGHRQFFPGERWEVVPRVADLAVELDVHASPSYASRHIWYGYGPWDYAAEPYLRWRRRNRMPGAFGLRTGHAYGAIITALQKDFDAHPEYYPLIGGERRPSKQAKLCIGNAGLRELVVQYAVDQFRKDPAIDSVSMDPSDGGGWCECHDCAALGTISDRVVVLANQVASAVDQAVPGKRVGIYAYNFHSPPPTVRVHPAVIVSVATAFTRGGLSVDGIMRGWAAQGATLGVREYYSVNTWDRDLPGQSRAGNLKYLARSIPEFHGYGARFLSSEAGDNWGPNGLGYYVASRLLWDVGEAASVGDIVEDFLSRAFASAKAPMRDFYAVLDASGPFLAGGDPLPRMFEALRAARDAARTDVAVSGRLDDLTLYAHYCALYRTYALAGGERRQAAFEALIRHAYRMRTTMMVHTKALYRDLPARDRTVRIPPGAEWNVPEGRNAWKSSQPFGAGEIEAFLREQRVTRTPGVAAARHFSDFLFPAPWLRTFAAERLAWDAARGEQLFLVQVVRGRPDFPVRLVPADDALAGWQDRVAMALVPADMKPAEGDAAHAGEFRREEGTLVATVRASRPGLYRVTVSSGDRVAVAFPEDMPMVVPCAEARPMNATYRDWSAYFYVPRGTKVVRFMAGGHGELFDHVGRPVFWLNGRPPARYSVGVGEGQDGKVWQVRHAEGAVTLLNVPPYFSPTPSQLLLPRDVLASDAGS